MTPNPEIVERMKAEMLATNPAGIAHIFYVGRGKIIEQAGNHACHAPMAYDEVRASETIGNLIPSYNDKIAQDFLEWLVSEDSIYYPIIKHLGDAFHIVRTEDGLIKGMIVDSFNVNLLLLTNFFKAGRTINEHYKALDFWKKWKIDRGKDPKICFVTSYFLDEKGNKITRSHSCLETTWANGDCFNLKVVADPKNNKQWNLNANPRKVTKHYYGENNETWGGGTFSFHKHIPVITEGEKLKTRFFGMYEDMKRKESGSYSDESVSNFLSNYKTLIKG